MVPEEQQTEDNERVMSVVKAALKVPPAEREGMLQAACENDRELLREVNEILAWDEGMGGFLREPLQGRVDLDDFERPFRAGDVLSNRFEIGREIGSGGMGVVYEAFDHRRECRIAIKAAKPGFRHLLTPELEGALKVRHPNICLVNEIHSAATSFGEVDFLTMELLEGETLSACLRTENGLSEAEVLQVARQLCSGVAEAHRIGIIHRDLKTANVILVRTPGQPIRAVITDFGLAGELNLDREQFGTRGYMAPELLLGERTSKASDIYALGVILRRLLGKEEERDINGTHKRHGRNGWERLIRQCLESSPAARPDAVQLLQGFSRRPLWRSPLLLVSLIASIAVGAALYSPIQSWLKPPDIRLAFLPVDAPAELTGIGAGVLHDVENRINRSQRAETTIVAIPVSEALGNEVRTPLQAQMVLHATHAVQLTLKPRGQNIDAELSVVDLGTQERVREFSGVYGPATVGSMPEAFTGAIHLALRLHSVSTDSLSSPATVVYDRALFFLRRDDDSYAEAIPLFEQAARLDPRSALPLAGLAEADILEFDAKRQHAALDEASAAIRAAESLNPDSVTVRLVSGVVKKTQGRYEEALEDYRRVQELEPRNIEALLRTASVYFALGDSDKALQCYNRAIALEPGYYGSYQKAGRFYYYRGNYKEAAKQFQKAVERAPGLYDAYNELGAALNYLGRDAEAEQALLKSLKLKETAGALNSLGGIHAYQNQDTRASAYFRRATQLDPFSYIYLLNLGDSSRRLGRLAEAKDAYSKAKDLAFAELQDNPGGGVTRSYVAYLFARLGDKKRAEQEIVQARKLFPDDSMIIRKAVLTYEALGERDRAIGELRGATEDAFHELSRHPDLANLREDLRFTQLATRIGSTRK